jgi:small subunit ribosomal protein S2
MIQLEKNKDTINKFLEAGLHFGHQTNKWDPRNKKFIFGEKNGIHIIDVSQTVDYLNTALQFLHDASEKGDILFVGTKKQAQDILKELARTLGMPYVISRWPGGLLTNFNSVKQRIKKIETILESFAQGIENRTKKELVIMKRELKKLERLYGGVRVLDKKPAALFVIDSKYEKNAVYEANKLGIPIVSLHDTNANPLLIQYMIPGNDDALKSIKLIAEYVKEAVVARTGMPDDIDFDQIDKDILDMTEKLMKKEVVEAEAIENKVVRVKSADIDSNSEPKVETKTTEVEKPVVVKEKVVKSPVAKVSKPKAVVKEKVSSPKKKTK